MTVSSRWRRTAAALAAAAAVVPFAATANAEPLRTANTTKWVRADFLQRTLGVPANTSLEAVTYDRFQHLLRQPGNFAILIGDPATDATFKARAVAADAAARAAGVQKVYWFNPNFTGGAKVGGTTLAPLDIRKADGLKLIATSRQRFKDAWQNLISQSLGNGVKAVRNNPGDQTQSVDTTVGIAGEVNDSVDPVFDYTSGATPANVADSYFFVYNTANGGGKDKIVSWVDLTKDAGADAKVAAAIAGKTFARVEQFDWWKEEANERHKVSARGFVQNGLNELVVTDADNQAADGGWRVNQITYPELIDLFDHSTDADAVVLFGGTWCPNTRAVLPFVNKEAQKNNVTVYNFDTVLDGGKVGGNPTAGGAASNPLQTRNTEPAVDAEGNGRFPSFLYGELVKQYLGNIVTDYQVTESNAITYHPGGDNTKALEKQPRLQVPFVLGYKGKGGTDPQAGVTRQWIQKNAPGSLRAHTEYMSHWWFTSPKPNQLGITDLPQGAPIWAKINADLAAFTGQADISSYLPNRTVLTDSAQYLLDSEAATVTDTGGVVSAAIGGANPVSISPASLAAAIGRLTANGALPASLAAAKTAWLADKANADLTTVVAAWHIADNRKSRITQAWGNATNPDSIAGAYSLKRALGAFFDGLPSVETPVVDTVVTPPVTTVNPVPTATPTPTPVAVKAKASKLRGAVSKAPTSKKAGKYKVTISTAKGKAKATGKVTLKFKKGKTTKTVTGTLKNGVVTVSVPKLARGTWKVTISWAGDKNYQSGSASGASIKVKK